MRITYIHQYFTTPSMAGGTRSYEMARRLVAAGHEVNMITSWTQPDKPQRGWFTTVEDGIRVHWLPIPYSNNMGFSARIWAFFRFVVGASRRAVSIPADIIFATSTPLTVAIPGVLAKRRHRVPLVFEVRDLWPELPIAVGALKNPILKSLAKYLERFAYTNSSQVIALSPGMRDGVIKTGYPASRVHVIPNSCDIKLFECGGKLNGLSSSFQELAGRPIVLYAGTFGVINGVSYLIDIAAELQKLNPEVAFLLVGDGKERQLVERKAEDLHILGKNLWIHSRLPKKHMSQLFHTATLASSIFINLPEMWNNSANKFFDALAAGKPIMINYSGWQRDILEQSGAGIAVPPNDPLKAAHMLNEFITDKEWLQKASAAARHLAKTQFNRDLLADQLRMVLEKAVLE